MSPARRADGVTSSPWRAVNLNATTARSYLTGPTLNLTILHRSPFVSDLFGKPLVNGTSLPRTTEESREDARQSIRLLLLRGKAPIGI
jgi:hypothetical protein